MHKAFQYRIYPSKRQKILLSKTFGCNRYIWNHFLNLENQTYKDTKKFLFYTKKANQLVDLKKNIEFLNEVNSQTLQQTLKHQDSAFKKFLKDKKRCGYPVFKSKKHRQSVTFPQHTEINTESGYTKICKIGNIPTIFHRKLEGRIKSCTVSFSPAGSYYISFCCEIDKPLPEKAKIESDKSLAIDLGLHDFLVSSDGTRISNPKFFRKSENKLVHHQRLLSRKTKDSKNYKEQRIQVAKVHESIRNKRKDFLYNLIKYICNDNQITTVFVENLNIQGMQRNHKLAKSIQDSSWGELKRILQYKFDWQGKNLVEIDRFFPSSKTCNTCGNYHKDLTLSDRTWICPECGTKLDRDLNAAKNLLEFGLYSTVSSNLYACSTLPRIATSGEVKERSMEPITSTEIRNSSGKLRQRSGLMLSELQNSFSQAPAFRQG